MNQQNQNGLAEQEKDFFNKVIQKLCTKLSEESVKNAVLEVDLEVLKNVLEEKDKMIKDLQDKLKMEES